MGGGPRLRQCVDRAWRINNRTGAHSESLHDRGSGGPGCGHRSPGWGCRHRTRGVGERPGGELPAHDDEIVGPGERAGSGSSGSIASQRSGRGVRRHHGRAVGPRTGAPGIVQGCRGSVVRDRSPAAACSVSILPANSAWAVRLRSLRCGPVVFRRGSMSTPPPEDTSRSRS